MCSTPRPKKTVIQKKMSTPAISSEMMARFSQVANAADDRRQARLDMQKAREQAAAQSMRNEKNVQPKKLSYLDKLYGALMS